MLKRRRTLEEQPATELVEEAFHLLRHGPGAALAAYFLGSLPFVLALLYFWSDMARSAFAEDHLVSGSLALALLFFWMKMWHAVFAGELLAHLAREPAPRWHPRRILRAGLHQAIVQPLGLIVLPLSLPLVVALGWTYAFFASATALAAGPAPDIKSLVAKSWRQMNLWPMQSQSVMFMFKLLALFVAINLALVILGLPFLARTLLGIESVVTRAPWAAANSTVLAAVIALTWLCLDPVLKTVYVLRCFHGESLQTGQDLRAELKGFSVPARALALVLLLPALLAGIVPGAGQNSSCSGSSPESWRPCGISPLTPALSPLRGEGARPASLGDGTRWCASVSIGPDGIKTRTRTLATNSTLTAAGTPSPLNGLRTKSRGTQFPSLAGVSSEAVRVGGPEPKSPQPHNPSAKIPVLHPVVPSLHAADPAPAPNSSAASRKPLAPAALDRSIDQVIQQREYSWRLPRDGDARRKPASNRFSRSLESFFKSIGNVVKAAGRWTRDFIDWLTRQSLRPKTGGTGFNLALVLGSAAIVLLLALLGVLVWLFIRLWRRRRRAPEVAAVALASVPDLADENVGADQLPEDGWVNMARDLLERGELRLALRALYLASLAALAARNLITLAKFKSNRDYERELARRGHALAELPGVFSQNVAVFERVWYGPHEVTHELVREFSNKVERLKSGA